MAILGVMDIIKVFFADGRVSTILGLILLDVILAVAVAIKKRAFDWRRLAEFYRTMVVPYVLGYLAFYLAAEFFFVPKWLGEWATLAGDAVQWGAWLALVGNLVADVVHSAKGLGYSLERGVKTDG